MLDDIKNRILKWLKQTRLFQEDRFDLRGVWVVTLTIQLVLEVCFLLGSRLGTNFLSAIRIVLFSLSSSLFVVLIAYLLPRKKGLFVVYFYIILNVFYTFLQLGYHMYMGGFIALKTSTSKVFQVRDYISDFFTSLSWYYWLFIIPFGSLLYLFYKLYKQPLYQVQKAMWLQGVKFWAVVYIAGIGSLFLFNNPNMAFTTWELYQHPSHVEMGLRQFGVNRFLQRDFVGLFKNESNLITIEPPEEIQPEDVLPDYERKFNDQMWLHLMELEQDEAIQQLDHYLMSRPITPKNEMTGYFKDKNLIFIMVETLDYLALDENIAPTLMKMKNEGWFFENYYAPKSQCSTGDSELMAITSLLAIPGQCNYDTYTENTFSQSLFELFQQHDYTTSSYHNYPDYFYERNTMHRSFGSERYYDLGALNMGPMPVRPDWPSDYELMVNALPHYVNEAKFFSFNITVTMHNLYNVPSKFGDLNLTTINALTPNDSIYVKRYRSKVMETDRALAYLLQELERQQKLDDTVIVLFGDHHLLRTPEDIIISHTKTIDREFGYNIDRNPLIIYNPNLEPSVISTVGSTKDLVPTLANLFDLNFDPRLYLGVDIFSDQADHFVAFQDGGWVVQEGYFDSVRQVFVADPTKYGSDEFILPDDLIVKYNKYVNDYYTISRQIFTNDYFAHRNMRALMEFSAHNKIE